jgi:DNA-nicking Smr family endonuclease
MRPPRGLSDTEASAWAQLAASVTPLKGRKAPPIDAGDPIKPEATRANQPVSAPPPTQTPTPPRSGPGAPAARERQEGGLDSHWNRKLKAGQIAPDLTLDLHGYGLDGAYDRIMSGLDQARDMGARLVLVVAGRERPVDPADRQTKRGAIRAKLLDWLAASRHADAIAAVRRAHIRHGGEGALYLVLRRAR